MTSNSIPRRDGLVFSSIALNANQPQVWEGEGEKALAYTKSEEKNQTSRRTTRKAQHEIVLLHIGVAIRLKALELTLLCSNANVFKDYVYRKGSNSTLQ